MVSPSDDLVDVNEFLNDVDDVLRESIGFGGGSEWLE